MAVYPTDPIPSYQSTRGARLPAIRTESEAGYGMTRKQFTRARQMFSLVYENISLAEFNTLYQFFLDNQGTVFSFSYPTNPLVSYDVMFAEDELRATDTHPNLCSTQVSLVSV